MTGDRRGVPSRDRAGQRGVAEPQRVVERGGQQRAEHPGRLADAGLGEQVGRLDDLGHQMIRRACQRGVVEAAVSLGDEHRLAAHLHDQDLGRRAQDGGAVTPKEMPASRSASSGRPVNVMTGCSASGSAPSSTAGSSTARPCMPLVWASIRPASGAPVVARPRTRPPRASSGTVSRTRSAAASDIFGLHHWRAGQEPLHSPPGCLRDRRRRDDPVTCATQGDRERGPDPAGADHADIQPRRVLALRLAGLAARLPGAGSEIIGRLVPGLVEADLAATWDLDRGEQTEARLSYGRGEDHALSG